MSIDWKKAEDHLADINDAIKYVEGKALGNVDMRFYKSVYNDLKRRFKNGERSDEFYQEIMEFKT